MLCTALTDSRMHAPALLQLMEGEDESHFEETHQLTLNQSKIDLEIREQLVRAPKLRFATLYKTVRPDYMHWWWVVDLGKKFLMCVTAPA